MTLSTTIEGKKQCLVCTWPTFVISCQPFGVNHFGLNVCVISNPGSWPGYMRCASCSEDVKGSGWNTCAVQPQVVANRQTWLIVHFLNPAKLLPRRKPPHVGWAWNLELWSLLSAWWITFCHGITCRKSSKTCFVQTLRFITSFPCTFLNLPIVSLPFQ